jgi:hypothetical protein
LICDIQGVGDCYTDPQIHTTNGEGFGKGNLGKKGFERFLASHRCNAICKYLNLPIINAKDLTSGTVPFQALAVKRVTNVNEVEYVYASSATPLLSSRTHSIQGATQEKEECCCVIL